VLKCFPRLLDARAEEKRVSHIVRNVSSVKAKRDFSLRRPTHSQERKRKRKSACSVRNDGGHDPDKLGTSCIVPLQEKIQEDSQKLSHFTRGGGRPWDQCGWLCVRESSKPASRHSTEAPVHR